jgi:mannose-6-phosphate isomerase-like protein (cupin superfamily)
MKRMTIRDLRDNGSRLFPEELGDRRIDHGGVYVFKPGEIAHPEARHVHDAEEVFIFPQGRGILPIDGIDYSVQTGDVFIVEAGEDHHLRSSMDDPLVSAWWVMAKA